MYELRKLSISTTLAAFVALAATGAMAQQPPPVPDIDERVAIEEIGEDSVTISVPYLFHEGRYAADIDAAAQWACSLYKRYAVPIGYLPSAAACDEMGAAAARRDPGCWHEHTFACALP